MVFVIGAEHEYGKSLLKDKLVETIITEMDDPDENETRANVVYAEEVVAPQPAPRGRDLCLETLWSQKHQSMRNRDL